MSKPRKGWGGRGLKTYKKWSNLSREKRVTPKECLLNLKLKIYTFVFNFDCMFKFRRIEKKEHYLFLEGREEDRLYMTDKGDNKLNKT